MVLYSFLSLFAIAALSSAEEKHITFTFELIDGKLVPVSVHNHTHDHDHGDSGDFVGVLVQVSQKIEINPDSRKIVRRELTQL